MRITVALWLAALFLQCCLASSVPAAGAGSPTAAPSVPQMQELQQKIMNDEGMMALISGLQGDPEVQALLNDPKVIEAVQGGDYGALLSDPRIQRLMNAPQVKEIGKRLQTQGPGEGR